MGQRASCCRNNALPSLALPPQEAKPAAPTTAAKQPVTGNDDAASAGVPGGAAQGGPRPVSPFAPISATMGWETFHLVITTWLSQIDLPARSELKNWELQVRLCWWWWW